MDRETWRQLEPKILWLGIRLEIWFFVLLGIFLILWDFRGKFTFLLTWFAWGLFFYYLALQVAKISIWIVDVVKNGKFKRPGYIPIERVPTWAKVVGFGVIFSVFTLTIVVLVAQVVHAASGIVNFITELAAHPERVEKNLELVLSKIGVSRTDAAYFARLLGERVISNTSLIGSITNRISAFMSSFAYIIDMLAGAFISVLIAFEDKNVKTLFARFRKGKIPVLRRISEDLHVIHEYMMHFTGNRMIIAIIVGFVIWLGFVVLGYPFAYVAALVGLITDLIPYVGPVIGWLFGVALVIPSSPTFSTFLWVTGIYIVAQIVENLVAPIVYSSTMEVSLWVVLLALVIGGKLGGVMGIVIGVPVIAALVEIGRRYLDRWIE